MKNTATYRRTAAAVGLVSTAALMVVSTVLAPEFPAEFSDRLAALDDAGTAGGVSAFTFALAQLPLIAGVLGVGHLLRHRAPVLSNIGTTLALVGAFGHSVYGGVTMVQLAMAPDVTNRSLHADVLASVDSGPAVAFMAMGLLGTVLGLLLLSIGVWRARVAPRWVAPSLWAFLVVEFVGTALSDWAAQLSVALYAVAFVGLAVAVWRSSAGEWTVGGQPQPSAPAPATV